MPTVSIIIPVYNSGQFLHRIVDSVLRQGYNDFELLLIDDGSSDDSGIICDAYAEKDNRIRVFHQENRGVSAARNLGLDKASGEWVYFVDSDDELMPDCLQTLVNGIGDSIALILCGYETVYPSGNVLSFSYKSDTTVFTRQELLHSLYPDQTKQNSYLGYLWIYLFRNSIIQTNNIRFNTSIRIKEDTLFITQYLCNSCGIISFTPIPIYRYMLRESSAMGTVLNEYNPGYITSIDAVIQMHSMINGLPYLTRDLSLAAENAVINRYYMISGYMKKHSMSDKGVIRQIKKKAINEVGLIPFLRCLWIRNKRRIIRKIHNNKKK